MTDSTEKSAQLEARASCWSCGCEASLQCSGCKEARFCSQACQKEDWINGGHKLVCQGPPFAIKINVILRELFRTECAWLQSLDSSDKARFFREDFRDEPINHLAIGGEVALVLARVNAAAVLKRESMHKHHFCDAYYKAVISPWYETHKKFLNQEGFYVEYITHDMYLADNPCTCVKPDGGPCGNLSPVIWGGCCIVKDVRSPKAALVDKIFAVERPVKLSDWNEQDIVKHQDLMGCVSFVAKEDWDDETRTVVEFLFEYPGQVYGSEDVCCSPCFRLSNQILPQDASALGRYFRKARRAMAAVGFPITMDMRHQEDWPDAAIARVWYSVAGSVRVFTKWLDNDELPFSVRVDDDRRDRITHYVYQRDLPVE